MKKFTLVVTLLTFFIFQLTKAQAPADTIGAGSALDAAASINNYVDLGDVYNSLTFPFSIEAWIYPTSYPQVNYFQTDNSENATYPYAGINSSIFSTGGVGLGFGDGIGNGPSNRRGVVTNSQIPLNTWTHVAIVASSVTNISIYFNGVLQTIVSDGGTSNVTTITHSGGPALINPLGIIDELRFWSDTLSQITIQQNMCRKINPNTPGLLGYWRMDEKQSSDTVYDYTSNGVNGVFVGDVSRVVSDAPLGNTSYYLYVDNWNDVSLSLGSVTGDSLIVGGVIGEPYGVDVYNVNSKPYDTTGLQFTPNNYFGVFCASSEPLTTYSVTCHYSLTDGVINLSNEDSATLRTRTNDSVGSWLRLDGVLSNLDQTIIKTGQPSPHEYILNDAQMETGIAQLSVNSNQLSVYPNPSGGKINITSAKTIDQVKVTNVLGQLIYEAQPKQTYFNFELNDVGMYFVTVTENGEISTSKIIVSK